MIFFRIIGFLLREIRDTEIQLGQRVIRLSFYRLFKLFLRFAKTLLPHVSDADAVQPRSFATSGIRNCARRYRGHAMRISSGEHFQ